MSESVSLTVTGMKCGGCESNVGAKINELDGIISVSASYQNNLVEVEFDQGKTSLEDIKQAITEAGFEVG